MSQFFNQNEKKKSLFTSSSQQNSKSSLGVSARMAQANVDIALENVSVSFNKTKALKSVSLTVTSGEILFITGASGAGKTTLLNVISNEQSPDKGKVFGNAVNGRKFLTRVYQDLRFIDSMSCIDNLELAYDESVFGTTKNFYDELTELSRVLGIYEKLDMKLSKANGGMKQKIAIMRALLSRPEILLADEPTCSMDKENAMKVFDVLNYYNSKRGLTVIWASHNRELVRNFPGKIVHLDAGKLVYTGHACFI